MHLWESDFVFFLIDLSPFWMLFSYATLYVYSSHFPPSILGHWLIIFKDIRNSACIISMRNKSQNPQAPCETRVLLLLALLPALGAEVGASGGLSDGQPQKTVALWFTEIPCLKGIKPRVLMSSDILCCWHMNSMLIRMYTQTHTFKKG